MITINLLPSELRPIKRTPLPYMITTVLVVLSLGWCLTKYTENVQEIGDLQTTLAQNKKELISLKDSVETYNKLAEEKKLLATQLKTIDEITSDRIVWSEQLHSLSRLALTNMWYSKMAVKTRVSTISVEVVDPESGKTKSVKEKISENVLTVEGFVSPDSEGRTSISPFTSATELDPDFSSQFQFIDFSMSDDIPFEEVTVKEFSLEYLIARGGTK
jgi:hypothetical protein